MEKNVIQKINAAEEIQMSMKNNADEGRHYMSLQATLQNFERQGSETLDKRTPLLSKKVKVINDVNGDKGTNNNTVQQHQSYPMKQHNNDDTQQTPRSSGSKNQVDACQAHQSDPSQMNLKLEDKVVLREKKVKETEDERRQKLSVHKDEIMKGNVKAAMEIFENLRKREELKGILCQVQEIEGENSSTDVCSLKTFYDNVPTWMVTPSRNVNVKQCKTEERKTEVQTKDDDLESISSVETAFEDLEKASREIMNLKEQTMTKLLEIEETIKKALYSVSNLKSEADIAGLSGLFDESLKSEQNLQSSSNIRKISIVSSKAKSDQIKETSEANLATNPPKEGLANQAHTKPLTRQPSSQSSPSFISIHSAARRPATQPTPPMSTFKPKSEGNSQSQEFAAAESSKTCPAQRKVSVLEVKTAPEEPTGIIGKKTVSETYEETDDLGNVFVSSVTSTFFTKHSDSKSSARFEVDGNPARYGVTTSPIIRRPSRPFEAPSDTKEDGSVFVTFSQPKEKH